jgi:hypothetical protein
VRLQLDEMAPNADSARVTFGQVVTWRCPDCPVICEVEREYRHVAQSCWATSPGWPLAVRSRSVRPGARLRRNIVAVTISLGI